MKRLAFALCAVLLAGCAGSQTAAPGVGGDPYAPASAPEWVRRGSRIVDGVVHGLGSAEGIGNTSLARSTAANRGRAEISRILQVYSASLMKDYQSSVSADGVGSEEQTVSQAIKTYSEGLLNGTEVKAYWLDARSNTWYALVALDYDRAREAAAARARMGGGLSQWVEDNGGRILNELDAELGPRVVKPAARKAAPQAKDPPASAVEAGPRPAWVDGACNREVHLCGVGSGPTAVDGDAEARGELARIFVARVQAVQESFQSANLQIAARTGEEWSEAQDVSSHSLVSSDKVVRFSEILARWQDGSGQVYSLAVIDRAQASASLRSEIEELDQQILQSVNRADGSDSVERFRLLRRAMALSAERAAKNGDLQVIDGAGVPAAVPLSEILARLDEVRQELRFGVVVRGAAADRVLACLEEALTAQGYAVESAASESLDANLTVAGEFDVRFEAEVRAEDLGQIGSSKVDTVEAEIVLRLIDGASGATFATVRGRERASRKGYRRAVSTAAYRLCKKQVPDLFDRIEARFRN